METNVFRPAHPHCSRPPPSGVTVSSFHFFHLKMYFPEGGPLFSYFVPSRGT